MHYASVDYNGEDGDRRGHVVDLHYYKIKMIMCNLLIDLLNLNFPFDYRHSNR